MTKKLLLFILVTCTLSLHAASTKKIVLNLPSANGELEGNRQSYVEYVAPEDNKLPILLLGPGVNRGLLEMDGFISSLTRRGYGVVAMHFSTLPHSVAALGKETRPYFDKEDFEMEDYAFEMEVIGNWARDKFKRDVVPVTLSFSGAPSSLLKGFNTIIDIAPMTSLSDARPTLGFYLQSLRTANMFNPFGRAVIRAAMDQTYYGVWRPKTEEMIGGFGFDQDLYDNILEGYMTSSRSLESFDWDPKETPKTTKRVLILAEEESESLLEGQVDVLKDFFRAKRSTSCFFIRGAGHAISFHKPVTTANVIDLVIKNKVKNENGCYDVKGQREMEFVPQNDLDIIFP